MDNENIRTGAIDEKILDHIKSEMGRVDYGRIIIELRKNSDKVDVVTESRQRFSEDKKMRQG